MTASWNGEDATIFLYPSTEAGGDLIPDKNSYT